MVDRTQPATLFLSLAALALATGSASAQRVIPQPVTDSAAQASPLNRVTGQPVNDAASQASPVTAALYRGLGVHLAPHTPIPIQLAENIDSGFLKQGQDVKAHLSAPVSVYGGPTLPAGTPVQLSVIASVPAGRMMAQGEFSLQVLRIGNINVYTDTLVFDGKPGHQDLPDSAPELGTDAGLPSGAPLTFRVQPQPTDSVDIIQDADSPGSVSAVAPGGAPPATRRPNTYGNPNAPVTGSTPGQPQNFVSPANTTTNQQVQNLGQASPSPNQMTSPAQPTGSTTPR